MDGRSERLGTRVIPAEGTLDGDGVGPGESVGVTDGAGETVGTTVGVMPVGDGEG